eukprot:6611572-Pyramimonas_sp.AAC.1
MDRGPPSTWPHKGVEEEGGGGDEEGRKYQMPAGHGGAAPDSCEVGGGEGGWIGRCFGRDAQDTLLGNAPSCSAGFPVSLS